MGFILKQNAIDIANTFTKWNLWKGSSGGGSGNYEEVTLFESETGVNSGDYSLNDSLDNFKQIFITTRAAGDTSYQLSSQRSQHVLLASLLDFNVSTDIENTALFDYDTNHITLNIQKDHFYIKRSYNTLIYKVIGVKF